MRVLLDECIPRTLKSKLAGHDCQTVPEVGLAGKQNGELLFLAEQAGFDCFLTLDRGIEYQQNLAVHKLAIILIHSKSSRQQDLLPYVPEILRRLQSVPLGGLTHVGL